MTIRRDTRRASLTSVFIDKARVLTHPLYESSSRSRQAAATFEAQTPRGAGFEPPRYLTELYWWAYAHPRAVRVFERDWLIDAILWGHYDLLRRQAIEAMGPDFSGRTLQVACVYGDFTAELLQRVELAGGSLDVIDALPVQIDNLKRKLGPKPRARVRLMDSGDLDYADATFERAAMFMLLHEQPRDWRRRTLAEAARTLIPGGRLVITDYARPDWRHPLRYLFPPVLWTLEPFALDLWREPLENFYAGLPLRLAEPRRTFFGGLYQLVVLEKV
jgi:ubiquinone/menaquinone biosynthesis C-methylase UbiE